MLPPACAMQIARAPKPSLLEIKIEFYGLSIKAMVQIKCGMPNDECVTEHIYEAHPDALPPSGQLPAVQIGNPADLFAFIIHHSVYDLPPRALTISCPSS
jgi:hypothetical protein